MPPDSVAHSDLDPALGQALAREPYLRRRRRPRWRDGDYLCLRDLNLWIQSQTPAMQGDVFDFGSGGAPYRDCFRHCRSYVTADIVPGPSVDRLLGPDGLTAEPDASYDWVFSTQVLEHVPRPHAYLRECRRILRPGGHLLLTTHGFYPEHGCPHDYHRWTAEGLALAARDAGLEVAAAGKLTLGVRAAVQLLHHGLWNSRVAPARPVWRLVLAVLRKTYGWLAVPALNALADAFPEQAHAPASDPTALYIGLYLQATRSFP